MQALVKGQVKAIFCVIMAFILAFGLSVSPVPSYADEQSSISVNGVTFLQPSADGWELLKVDNLDKDQSIYITVYKTEEGKRQPLGHAIKFSASDLDAQSQGSGDKIAQLVVLNLLDNASSISASTAADLFADPEAHATYSVEVSSALMGKDGDLYEGVIYPVYAKLVDPDGQILPKYSLLGVRTSDTKDPQMLGVGTTFYKQNTKSTNSASIYALAYDKNGIDNEFDKDLNAFVVTYNKAEEGAVEGKIRYVDLDGNLIKESEPIVIDKDVVKAPVEEFFTVADKDEKVTYYRTISSLGNEAQLSINNATYTVKVIPILANDVAYTVTINYVDENNNLLWSDGVVVTGENYNYTLPNVFSINKKYRPNKKAGVDNYTLGTVKGGKVVASVTEETTKDGTIMTAEESTEGSAEGSTNDSTPSYPVAVIEGNASSGTVITFDKTMVDDDFVTDPKTKQRTVTAVYNSQAATGKVDFTLQVMNGQTGDTIDTIKKTITPTEGFSYDPVAEAPEGFVPWAGNTDKISYTWESLGQGVDLLQYVYYVPENYTPAPAYEIKIQYMNIADTQQPLREEFITVDPENNNYIEVVGDPQFVQDGNTYVRLPGQETGIRHASLSPNRTYTIYYRDVNDTINANTIIDRVQIIETTIPGTGGSITAAGVTADGTPDAGVTAGDGTVVINDENNPLTNLDGQDTTTERIIDENENPLASGNIAQNPLAIAGIVAGVIALAGIIAYIFYRRRKKANDAQNA